MFIASCQRAAYVRRDRFDPNFLDRIRFDQPGGCVVLIEIGVQMLLLEMGRDQPLQRPHIRVVLVLYHGPLDNSLAGFGTKYGIGIPSDV